MEKRLVEPLRRRDDDRPSATVAAAKTAGTLNHLGGSLAGSDGDDTPAIYDDGSSRIEG